MTAPSGLGRLIERGEFVVTAECGPPRGTDVSAVVAKAHLLKGHADAVNVTDNQTAVVHMSSVAACRILIDQGIEPVLQMVCRDRNRIALQSDLLGAYALGIRNVLMLSGDHQSFGNQPGAKPVYDLDSIQLVRTARTMRDQRTILGGDAIEGEFAMLLGAAENPFGDPLELRLVRLRKKIEAGADFIQTQAIFNMDRFRSFMTRARDMGLCERVAVLAGLVPLRSLSMARYLATKVSGIDVPESLLKRIEGVPKKDRAAEGVRICVEQIAQLRQIPGVRGIHLMAIQWEEKVAEIVAAARLSPRPEA